MTPEAGLLWLAALVLATALAFWDYATSEQDTPAEPDQPAEETVEVDVVYGD